MMRTSLAVIALLGAFSAPSAQDAADPQPAPASEQMVAEPGPLEVFGYFQAKYAISKNHVADRMVSNLLLQQLNIFLSKDLGGDFSALVNLQLINNYSSIDKWGGMKLSDAWVRWAPTPEFKVKSGLLVPKFGHFNEIKDKTPLLPYIWRPLAYESSLNQQFDLEAMAPGLAMAQVEGTLASGVAKLDYAIYAGNSNYLVTEYGLGRSPGFDTTSFKMIGGRLGGRASSRALGSIDIGVSSTYEKSSNPFLNSVIGQYNEKGVKVVNAKRAAAGLAAIPDFKTVHGTPRLRLGCDLTVASHGLTFEGEMIKVLYTIEGSSRKALDALHSSPVVQGGIGNSLDKSFYTANLTWDLPGRASKFFTTAGWSYVQDETFTGGSLAALGEGLHLGAFGGGFRPNDRVSLKVQAAKIVDASTDHVNFDMSQFLVATSVFF